MIKYFKEQLDAGPADGVSEEFMVYYMVESDSGIDMLRIDSGSIDNLDDKYLYDRHEGAVPIIKPKDQT